MDLLGVIGSTGLLLAVLAILALGFAGYALASDSRPDVRARGWLSLKTGPYVANQRRLAARVGVPFRVWVALRVGVVVGLGLIGIASHLAILAVGGVVMGHFGFPWMVRHRADTKQEQLNRALVATCREIVERMGADRAFDVVVREIAENPRAEVANVLAPLKSDRRVSAALMDAAVRAQTPLAEMVFISLMLARSRDQEALLQLLKETMVPTLSKALEIEDEDLIAAGQQRAITYVMLLISAGALYGMQLAPVYHEAFATATGQVVLGVAAAIFGLCIYGVEKIRPRPKWAHWDLEMVRREFGALDA